MWQTAFGKKEKKVLNTLKSKKFQGITKKKKKKISLQNTCSIQLSYF